MALNDIERKRTEKTIGAFLEKHRPAPHIRPQIDLGFRISGQSVVLFELRPQLDRPEARRETAIAKATFVRTQGTWKMYWKRADLKWQSYAPAPQVATIDRFLAVVQEDEYGCFFG